MLHVPWLDEYDSLFFPTDAGERSVGAHLTSPVRDTTEGLLYSESVADAAWPRASSALRCLNPLHDAACRACAPPPTSDTESSFELLPGSDRPGAAVRSGERRLRTLLACTQEWASASQREILAVSLEASSAVADDAERLVRALRTKNTALLRKRDMLVRRGVAWPVRARAAPR